MPATKAKPSTKKSTKGKKMQPNEQFGKAPPDYVNDPDAREKMLRAAMLVKEGAKARWDALCDRSDGGNPTNGAILDQLAEEWADNPECLGDKAVSHPAKNASFLDWSWKTRGGALPGIWFGQSIMTSEPHLQGMALAEVVRPIALKIADERDPLPASPIVHCEQPPNGVLPITKIKVVENPRTTFDEASLNELADSIRAVGIIQALTVSPPDADGMHTLIAGERRLRAARKAELTEVPVHVRVLTSEDTPVARIVENVNREALTSIEEAAAYQQLLDGGLSQRELARKIGKTQGYVGNRVRLLKLPEAIQADIAKGIILQAEGRDLASWTDRPAVIDEFERNWKDRVDPNGDGETWTFAYCLQEAVLAASRAMDKGRDGPRFKVTPQIRQELDIVHVKLGRIDSERAFYTPLWNQLQKDAEDALAAKRAAKANKPVAAPDEREPEVPAEPVKPKLSDYAISNMWCGWFMRALVQRFSTKKLKPADADHLTRLAIILLEPYPHLLDELKLSDRSDEETAQAIAQQTTEGLLDALRVALMRELLEEPLNLFANAAQARALCDSVGISIRTWTPDAKFLTVVHDHLLLDWASEYEMKPSKVHDKLVDQLVECWTIGWIPEPFNIFPAAE